MTPAIDVLKAPPQIVKAVGNTAQEMQTLSDQTGLDLYDNSMNNAYLQFGQNPTNGNALAVYDASLQNLDGAMAQQQAGTISLTDSQLGAINAQTEVVQVRANELVVQGQTGNTYSTGKILTQTEQLVTTLQALPPTIKAKIGYDGVFNALLSAQMNGSNVELAQVALDKARAGVEAALEMDGLDAGTRSALEGLLGEIDNGKSVYDNRVDARAFKDEQLKTEPNTTFFWSGNTNGVGGMTKAAEIALQNGGTTLEMLLERQGIKMPKWDFNNPIAVQAWKDASASYARQASGEVRAIIGSTINPDGVWTTIELPILKANPNVSKIIIIDPETLIETIIFSR